MQNVELYFPLCRGACAYWISVCMSIPAVPATTRIAPVCPKCVIIKKSGKLSCCAPGGAWFKNCGASGNSNTEHTWGEGMQACKDAVSLISGKAESQFIKSVNQTTTTKPLHDVGHQNVDSTLAVVYDSPTGNSKNNDQRFVHRVLNIHIH